MGHPRVEVVDRSRSPLRPFGLPLAVLAVLLLGAVLAARPAPAHAVEPVAAEPYARQELSDPPGAVTLAFGRQVDPSAAKVIVSGPDGRNVTSGPLIVEGTNVTSRLRDGLPRGTYTVHYRIDGSGGEPEGGAYQFSYGSGRFTDLPDRSWSGDDEEPAVLRGTDPNGSEAPEAPTTTRATPGIEVTSEGATTDPEPPATEPASTVEARPARRPRRAAARPPRPPRTRPPRRATRAAAAAPRGSSAGSCSWSPSPGPASGCGAAARGPATTPDPRPTAARTP